MLFKALAPIGVGRVVKIVEDNGEAKIAVVGNGLIDPDSTGVVGITASATTTPNQTISVGGVYRACVEQNRVISIGDQIEKSDTVGQEGKVFSAASSAGTFGIALTAGTGDVNGTVFVSGIFMKNELL
jgi:hypothetical protein